MLVVSRKKNEKIFLSIGGVKIACVIVDVRGNRVRIGVDAPPEVSIVRDDATSKEPRDRQPK